MNQRDITPAQVEDVPTRPVQVVTQSNGNHVVDGGTGEIVTVLV
jgi:hypothetical protein